MAGSTGRPRAAADAGQPSRVWTFAGCRLDERSLELTVQGAAVALDRKPLEVLLHLLRHAGEVVTKDELAAGVWPGRIITDSNLTKTVAVVRAALGAAGPGAIKTVHGYGYRFVAAVSVEVPAPEELPPRLQWKEGDAPPLRADWRLTTLLGRGGQGEVWLAHHIETRQPRVFKFAEAGRSLAALKREITLSRLLRETLPQRSDFLWLLDWNVEGPPFFVETDYVPGGNLAAWAEKRGGLAALPLELRLELLAQVADAVAAAHSVGVLHKDLKPANVLVAEPDGVPRIRLADFGSGTAIDPGALAAHDITRMGFTQAAPAGGDTSGTPAYLAPEVLAGQPFTIKSDVYALGVMLYQLVAGDARKALAPGWEKSVADELLREDIAAAAAGDPTDRLADAAGLARRLRMLTERRVARRQVEKARHLRDQLKRLRVAAVVLLLIAGVATAAGGVAYRARNAARRAAATTQAVTEFLNRDVLAAADPREGPVRDLTVRKVLDRAGDTVDGRFGAQPEAAAQVHATLAEAYRQIGDYAPAQRHAERAVELFGDDDLRGIEARGLVAALLRVQGHRAEGCALAQEVRDALARRLRADDARLLAHRADSWMCAPDFSGVASAIPELAAIAADFERRGLTGDRHYPAVLWNLANAEFSRLQFAAAEAHMRKLVAQDERALGAGHVTTVRHRAMWSGALTFTGRLPEADAALDRAFADLRAWSGEGSGDTPYLTIWLAILRTEQGRWAEAEAAARSCLDSPLGSQKQDAFRLAALLTVAEGALLQGRPDDAIRATRDIVATSREMKMPAQYYELPARIVLADALLQRGRIDEAASALEGLDAPALAVPAGSYPRAWLRRSQALLSLHRGEAERARGALRESLDIYQALYGADHWRTRRARRELERAAGG